MTYTWINEPPIVEITDERLFEGLCAQFITKIYAAGLLRPATDEALSWNERIDNSIRSFSRIRDRITDWRGFVYKVAGMPIGLMVISEMIQKSVGGSKSALTISLLILKQKVGMAFSSSTQRLCQRKPAMKVVPRLEYSIHWKERATRRLALSWPRMA
jgi:hypothetical protein